MWNDHETMTRSCTYEAIISYMLNYILGNWLAYHQIAIDSYSSILVYRSYQEKTNSNIGAATQKHTILLLLTSSVTSSEYLKLVRTLLVRFQHHTKNQKGIKMPCLTVSIRCPSWNYSKHVLLESFSWWNEMPSST